MTAALFHDLQNFSDRIAVVGDDNACVSYGDLLKRGQSLAASVDKRCLVAFVCENSIDCLAAYVGLIRAGCALLLLHHTVTPEQRAEILNKFQPRYIAAPQGTEKAYTIKRTPYTADYALHDDLCLLLTTSGTTGSRSFVRQSYKNVIANARSIVEFLGITASERAITTMPMNYTYGLSIIHSHLLTGASLVVTEATLVSPQFWKLIKDSKATTFGGVPFIYDMLKKLRFEKMDLPVLRYISQAGGKLSPEMVAEFAGICQRKNIRFNVMYGQTEATARMAWLPPEQAAQKPASIGVAIPGGRFELCDDSENVITQPNMQGNLIYYGDNVTMGYATGFADLAKGDENNGRLVTGDIAMRDADGFYHIAGRKKRFLKIFGTRVSLDEVEYILKTAGYDCACGGVDDRMAVYLAGSPSLDAVKAIMSEKTNLSAQGYRLIPVDVIPRNESGKVDYARLKERATA